MMQELILLEQEKELSLRETTVSTLREQVSNCHLQPQCCTLHADTALKYMPDQANGAYSSLVLTSWPSVHVCCSLMRLKLTVSPLQHVSAA